MNQFKYFVNALLAIPLLPLLYFQGKKIKKNIPNLPEAIGNEGVVGNSDSVFNLLTMGESTIAGVGAKEHKDGITGALATYLATHTDYTINWKVIAKSGYNVSKVVIELVPNIDFQPNLIVIGLGANDAFEFNSPKKWKTGVENLIEQLHDQFPKSPIVFMNMPPIHAFPAFTKSLQLVLGNLVDLLGNELELISRKYSFVFYYKDKILFKDWLPKVESANSIHDLFSDGVHPAEVTYQLWGRETAKFILANELL